MGEDVSYYFETADERGSDKATLACIQSALQMKGVHKVKETVPHPQGWSKSRPAPADHVIELRIALPQSNFAELERHLYEVR